MISSYIGICYRILVWDDNISHRNHPCVRWYHPTKGSIIGSLYGIRYRILLWDDNIPPTDHPTTRWYHPINQYHTLMGWYHPTSSSSTSASASNRLWTDGHDLSVTGSNDQPDSNRHSSSASFSTSNILIVTIILSFILNLKYPHSNNHPQLHPQFYPQILILILFLIFILNLKYILSFILKLKNWGLQMTKGNSLKKAVLKKFKLKFWSIIS